MNVRAPLVVAVVAVLLAIAGCAGPAADGPSTAGGESVPTANGGSGPVGTAPDGETEPSRPDLGVAANATFERVARLMAVDARPPRVRVEEIDPADSFRPSRFQRTMGVTGTDWNESAPGGVTTGPLEVHLDPGAASPARVERTLVHEFVHAIQHQRRLFPDWSDADVEVTTDFTLVRRSLVEGGAVWVTDRYLAVHRPDATRQATAMRRGYRRGPDFQRHVLAPYHFGSRYVDSRIDSATNLAAAYEDPPRTTEQVLHPRERPAEPPAALSLRVRPASRLEATDTQGEMAIRVILRSEVAADRARRGAAGWGADRLAELDLPGAGEYGYAWALRWDAPADADEFAAAFERYADRRTGDAEVAFRVVRISEETVVVLAGPPAFVDGATADGTSASVRVTVGDAAS